MSLAYKSLFIAVILILIKVPALHAGDDKWFSKDKYQHFTVSAFGTLGSSVVLNRHFDMSKEKSIGISASFTFSIGLGKEAADKYKPTETSSLKDLIWDAAGILTGVALASLAL